ncbi:MAG: tRNA uridine-5-carboxymethylaminomethyl(34) synthesis GTPase MnmE [Desulfobulbaceae bacterium]|nr:tRNA uridine-5-carboxymethylaminomethyl(34) synthesis GTPase MnmE [Desulfobulbaceae bacterium]
MVLQNNDTIAAIATPPGIGGIGIIRISGPLARSVLNTLFRPHRPHEDMQSRKLYYGTIVDRAGTVLDEILAVFMQAPNTYTREDVVELQSHGSSLVLNAILAEVLHHGVRLADPGEFTKRAFLAGRIDLTRAEAVIDLLKAKTDTGVQLAVGQLQGQLYQRIEEVRNALVTILAVLEVAIDFPDDDVELVDREGILRQLAQEVEMPLAGLIAMADQGKIIREGIHIVIAGRPNVGKSSLLNALLQEDRALVTPVPGTTRDTIEEMISIRGIPARLVDTAGIRDDSDSVEELGIRRARQKMREADLVLFMVDSSVPLTAADRELYNSIGSVDRIVVLNKIDIADAEITASLAAAFPDAEKVNISARNHQGLQELQEIVFTRIMGEKFSLSERDACAPNVRHRAVLKDTLAASKRLRRALAEGVTVDLAAIEVQTALDCLGDIVGLTTTEDVLDKIFAEFCIGK